jgi:hypothetical protein
LKPLIFAQRTVSDRLRSTLTKTPWDGPESRLTTDQAPEYVRQESNLRPSA